MTEPAVEIETPGLGQLESLVTLWIQLVEDQRKYGTFLMSKSNASNAKSWLATQLTVDGVRIARCEGEIVGFVTFELMRDQFSRFGQDGIIHNVYVKPSHRGRGIGQELMTSAEELLSDRGADRVRLEVLAANEAALKFYRDEGYVHYRSIVRKSLSDVEPSDQ